MIRMSRQRGYVLLLTISLMGLLVGLITVLTDTARREASAARRFQAGLQAETIADAGLDLAIYYLTTNPRWQGGWPRVTLPQSKQSFSMTFVPDPSTPFSVNNALGKTSVKGYGREVPAGTIQLVCVGEYDGATRIRQALVVYAPEKSDRDSETLVELRTRHRKEMTAMRGRHRTEQREWAANRRSRRNPRATNYRIAWRRLLARQSAERRKLATRHRREQMTFRAKMAEFNASALRVKSRW